MVPAAPSRMVTTHWDFAGGGLLLDRPRIMGILNATPDSFSDGGAIRSLSDALRQGEAMIRDGADLLDVGGESTRPGAEPVALELEQRRVAPVVEALVREFQVPVSVDTRKAAVAQAALDAGARIVNDVSGLAYDPGMAPMVARSGAGLVLMHMRGTPQTMAGLAGYGDVVADVVQELGQGLERALGSGIRWERIVVDPGIGFAKTGGDSLRLLNGVGRLRGLGCPVLVGPSRKSFLDVVEPLPVHQRAEGTLAACVLALAQGVRLFRVHDVRIVARGLRVAHAIQMADVAPSGVVA